MKIGNYTLANADKVERAINGTVLERGAAVGGVGADASPAEIMAEYDRLGGLILKDGKYKVKTGSFYDFKNKKAIAKPAPVLLFMVNNEVVEVPADEPLPLEVRAAEQANEKKAAKKRKAAAKKGGKKGKKEEVEEEEEDEDEEVDTEDESDEDDEEGEELA